MFWRLSFLILGECWCKDNFSMAHFSVNRAYKLLICKFGFSVKSLKRRRDEEGIKTHATNRDGCPSQRV